MDAVDLCPRCAPRPHSPLRSSATRNRIGRLGRQRRSSFRLVSRSQGGSDDVKKDFTEEEWTRVRRAPLVAGLTISIADPGGPIELTKETMASMRSATLPPSQEALLASVALDVQAMVQQKQNPLGDFKPTNGQLVLDELGAVNEIVTAKASPQEVEAFRG